MAGLSGAVDVGVCKSFVVDRFVFLKGDVVRTPYVPFAVVDHVFVAGAREAFVEREADVERAELRGFDEFHHAVVAADFFV